MKHCESSRAWANIDEIKFYDIIKREIFVLYSVNFFTAIKLKLPVTSVITWGITSNLYNFDWWFVKVSSNNTWNTQFFHTCFYSVIKLYHMLEMICCISYADLDGRSVTNDEQNFQKFSLSSKLKMKNSFFVRFAQMLLKRMISVLSDQESYEIVDMTHFM